MNDRLPAWGWNLSDLEPAPAGAPRVLSTFSCGGGSSMGYKRAGCHIVGSVDIDQKVMRAYQRNLGPVPYYLGSIGDLEQMRSAGLLEQWTDLDILDGSPPCTPFSTGGKRDKNWGKAKMFREGQTAQILDRLFFDYLNLVRELEPKIFIAENVSGMLQGKSRGYVKAIVNEGRSIGYDVQVLSLNAHNYGVPQSRSRVFFIGRRTTLGLRPVETPARLGDACPVIDAIGDLTHECAPGECVHKLKPGRAEMWDFINPGSKGTEFYKKVRGMTAGFSVQKLHPDFPARTLAAGQLESGDVFHYAEKRSITELETLRLSGFPDDYQADSRRQIGYLCGMSVPPPLAEAVAREALAVLGHDA
jgi:DNA (cytosine-5)-methyltransferase 1